MTRKENASSTLLIRLSGIIDKNVPVIVLVQGGGSPSNHHSVTKNSSLFGCEQHDCDIRLGQFFSNMEVEMDRQQGRGLEQGSISKPTWEKCSIKILIS